ncbi:MAG TPA: hypothetical protein EYP88_01545 [Anaerolineales bacterium]|nr:hypothetical protein [Anaerolineales bacterium]
MSNEAMSLKLLLTWDILPGREQEYFEFVVREFIPGIQSLGLEPTDAWLTIYGEQPQILTGIKAKDLTTLNAVMVSDEWDAIITRLLDYVNNLEIKTVRARPGFQM